MASNRLSKSSTPSARRKSSTGNRDAIGFLTSQHREVEDLFKEFEKLGEDGSTEEKEPIVRMACEKLTVHSTIEEEIFYPAAREVEGAESLLNEAQVEHQSVKDLINSLESMNASDEMFSATFTVLSESSSITSGRRKASSSLKSGSPSWTLTPSDRSSRDGPTT